MAKQAATVDRMTGGRLVLGLGIGGRDDDHRAAGTDLRTRGRRLDEQMAVMRRLWSGEPYGDGVGPIGPAPARPTGPEVLFGGFRPAALERVARWGDGFLAAAAPSWADGLFETVHVLAPVRPRRRTTPRLTVPAPRVPVDAPTLRRSWRDVGCRGRPGRCARNGGRR